MPGLLERALRFAAKKETPRGSVPQVSSSVDESGVSGDERRELAVEIERLFTGRRAIDAVQITTPTRRRTGAGFPLLVGIAAAVVLAGGMLGVRYLSVDRLGSSATEARSYKTTEGLVVEKIKQQSEAQLSDREARIAAIKRELDSIRNAPPGAGSAVDAEHQRELSAELAALQSEASTRITQISALQSEANTRLSELAARRNRQEFLSRQLQAIYENIQGDLAAEHLEAALSGITSANRLLDESTADPNGDIAIVAPALRSGNAVLRQALLFGEAAIAARNPSYAATMSSQIDDLKRNVAALQASLQEAQRTVVAQKDRIAAQEGMIADQSTLLGKQRLELLKRTEDLSTVVNSMERSIALFAGARSGAADATTKSDGGLVGLLKTKLAIRQLASSPEARSSFPGLSDELDAFFAKYAAIYSEQGRLSTLEALASTLNDVIAALHLNVKSTSSDPLS